MKTLLTLFWLCITYTASADYLIVQRNGNMRAEPSSVSEILERIHTGDTLILLDAGQQTDSYYHVRGRQSGQEGWVFRTLVRKVAGETGSESVAVDDNTVTDIRVLDVGAGLCTLIKLPGDKYVIYDAGSDAKLNGNRTLAQVKEYIPEGSVIELLVLSHCDADHINAAEQVVRDYKVKKVLWTGYEASMAGGTTTGAYTRLVAILKARPATENVNLHARDSVITPGNGFTIGSAKFTFLCGFGSPLAEWQGLDRAEKLNGVSIVMKMDFKGNSVLFGGDAVGRHRDDPENALIATEKFMVEKAAAFLPSTIIIAPHHGAKNGSSTAFVNLVKPKAVIFSAGHIFHHPTTRTAKLYLQFTSIDSIFRTDRGDDEGGDEWSHMRKSGCTDLFNDDTIQIQLRSNGSYRVFYMTADGPCK
jgi:beta-lactamase superfamily II metal-dependent hydrolase